MSATRKFFTVAIAAAAFAAGFLAASSPADARYFCNWTPRGTVCTWAP
jgi:hypothetical protein